MQAVLPIAGKSSRMAKKYQGPKQLLSVAGKPLVEYPLAVLPDKINELVLVVGGPYEKQIRDYFGTEHKGRKVTYVRQTEQKGLGHAVQLTRDVIRGRFLVLVPDDIYGKEDLQKMAEQKDMAALAQRRSDPENFGVFVCNDEGYITNTVEKPKEFVSDLVSAGACFLLDKEFFEVHTSPSARGEIELPDIVNALIKERGRKVKVVETDFWVPVNDPEQLNQADSVMRKRLEELSREGEE